MPNRVPSTPSTTPTTSSRTAAAEPWLVEALQGLSVDAWELVLAQGREGLGVTDAEPGLLALYKQQLARGGMRDTPQNRSGFVQQLLARYQLKASELMSKNDGLPPSFAQTVDALGRWSAADEASFQQLLPRRPVQRQQPQRTDRFELTRATRDDGVIRVESELEEYYPTTAKTPDEALAMRTDKVAKDTKLLSKLEAAIAKGQNPFTGDDGEIGRRAYRDFISQRGLSDTPQNRKLFVSLMKERQAAVQANGGQGLDALGDRKFWADAALRRLEARAKNTTGPVELADDERWMISALADPKVKFTPEQQTLLDRVGWRDQGLRTWLGEVAAKNKAADAWRPGLGQPYSTMLNAATVFDGDPQMNAFSMAAKAAGYSDAELRLVADHWKANGWGLYVRHGVEGEPRIQTPEDTKLFNIGGQRFVRYSMTPEAAAALRDARYAVQQGYTSLADYQKDFNTTWSDKVGWLGSKLLELEQAKDKLFGLDQSSVTGPLVRGKYDAMRELILVGSNAANLTQMAVSNTAQFIRTGDPFVSIAKNEELNRYYDGAANRVEQTFAELGRTYPQEEQNVVAEIARGTIAGVPKMAVNLIPGAAIYYNALKHANRPFDEFAKETVIDLASIAGGFALSRVTSGVSGAASKYFNTPLAQATVRQVVERGGSAVGGATLNVAMDMGPAALRQVLGDDSPAAQKEAAEKLSMAAFKRNVWSGIVFGLVAPGRYTKDDFVTLGKPGATLEGPLFRTRTPDGAEHYYSAVRVTENGKTRVEFVEADPQSPKVQQAVREGRVKDGRQADIDYALAQSRWSRLSGDDQTRLAAQANQYAAKKLLADAEAGVQYSATRTSDPKQAQQNAKASKDRLLEVYKLHAQQNGYGVDPIMTFELAKATPERLLEVFGEGPYPVAMMELFRRPGFGDLVKNDPAKARALYQANEYTNVLGRIDAEAAALKSQLPPGQVGPKALDNVAAQLANEGTVVTRANGFVNIERQPGKTKGWAYEMVLEDRAMQQAALKVENGKIVSTDGSTQPTRIAFDPKQLAVDPTRSLMLNTHGSINGLDGITPERLTEIARKIVEKGEIDNVVLVACNQGDLRPQGGTAALQFMQDLNAQVKALSGGKRSIEVFASKEPGVLTGTTPGTGDTVVGVNIPDNRPRVYIPLPDTQKAATMVPVLLQDKVFEVPPSWYDQTPARTGPLDRPAFVYVIRVNEDQER